MTTSACARRWAWRSTFAWTNDNLLHGQYVRTNGLFDNSALGPTGPAAGLELELLEPWRDQLPEALFEAPYVWPETDGSGRLRKHLNTAGALLDEAGYVMVDGVRRNGEGHEITFEVMLADSTQERILLPWIRNLERLGVTGTLRTIDAAQHQSRISEFDYDAMVWRWGVSLSPGNEQWIYWGSDAAAGPGQPQLRRHRRPRARLPDCQPLGRPQRRRPRRRGPRARPRSHVGPPRPAALPPRRRPWCADWDTIQRPEHVPLYGVDFTILVVLQTP